MPTTRRPPAANQALRAVLTRPHSDTRRVRPVSFADLAREAGVHRSSVTRAARGPLAAALLPGGRIDIGHPSVVAWLGWGPPAPPGITFIDPSRLATFEQLAELAGVPVSEVLAARDELEDAVPIDFDHPVVQAFLADHGVVQ